MFTSTSNQIHFTAGGEKVLHATTTTAEGAARAAELLNRGREHNDKRRYTAAARFNRAATEIPGFEWAPGHPLHALPARCCICGNTKDDHAGHEFSVAVPEEELNALRALRDHVIALKDDAHLTGHPEWNAITAEAETGSPAEYDGPGTEEDRPHRGTDIENG